MSEEIKKSTEVVPTEDGKIIFSDEVVATIAALAAADVPGVSAMSGGVVEGFTEKFGKKVLTKGVKVEVGTEEAAIDLSVLIEYGYRIQEVCASIQKAVKTAVETMTGLRVVEVNVFVQAISFENLDMRTDKKKQRDAEKAERAKAKEEQLAKDKELAEKETVEPAPRVK